MPRTDRAIPRFLLSHPAHFIALGAGSGLAPFMPGTFGSLFGWLLFVVLDRVLQLTPGAWSMLIVLAFALGVWACERTGHDLGVHDAGAMVWDEIVAMWLVLLFVPGTSGWQLAAFLVFRVFDITKPVPIRQFEQRFRNGFGVMADDVLAAFYTLLVLALWVRVFY